MKMLQPLQVYEHKLSNGLSVWLNEDHSQPKVFGAIVVKAGAVDCPDTGIAHYFEHMMFKGTDKIGTTDYAAEKDLLDRIAEKYDALAATRDETERRRLHQTINELSVRAARYVVPGEFDRLISRYGGTKLNAGTSYDYTVYFNTFSPQYMAHWAELNSERLINPVFRLFQSELETVYEEKNMYSDFVGSQAVEKLTARYFAPHPYAYPIIGSTENLKNPRLTEMRRFFETYYVASNMGLILSGDFRTETVLPLLEAAFSRIPDGKVPPRKKVALPDFKGREKVSVKVPIPFMKVMALGFRGLPAGHPDQVALNIAVSLLNNANGTGYLDKLTVDHKVVASMAMNESMNEAGILGILVMPKLLFQSYGSAEKLVWKQIDRVKNGDFSEETFRSLLKEQKREYASSLEDIASRAQVMMRVFSQGKNWADYLAEVARIDALTPDDVVRAARKYFTRNYLYATKKSGRYPKDRLPKPDYAPVLPAGRKGISEYVRRLEALPVEKVVPRFIDFEGEMERRRLTGRADLYVVPNPVNDIFSLDIVFGRGQLEQPLLFQLAGYLNFIGTESLPFEEFRRRLQTVGSTLSFEVDDMDFKIRITGFDASLDETLALAGDFMRHPAADGKKLKQIIDEARVVEKGFLQSSESLAKALLEKVKYGAASRYLTKLSLSEIRKLKAADLIDAFREVQQVEAHIHYCGTRPATEVEAAVRAHLPLDMQIPSLSSLYREPAFYREPAVYFLDMPEVSQSIVYAYIRGEAEPERTAAHASELFTGYFGGDMSSLMFQEIREYRSFAYRVNARYNQPSVKHRDRPGDFVAMLSTQNDKTADAMEVLDGLIRQMPEYPERVEAVKQNLVHKIYHDYPAFRKLSSVVAAVRREGYADDPNRWLLEDIGGMDMDTIAGFYRRHVAGRPVTYVVVGGGRQIGLDRLAAFGPVKKVSKRDIYR